MFSTFYFVVILFALFIYWGTVILFNYWNKRGITNKKDEIPWGYKGIPGIGFLPNFRNPSCRRKLIGIREHYGSICKVRMGSYICVWLNDYNLIKEAWGRKLMCGRPDIDGISIRTKGFRGGIIFNDGKAFIEQRRFVMHTLKIIGLGKGLSEKFILEEVQDVISTIAKHKGAPISTQHLFNIPAFNIIWRIVTGGSRFKHDDPVMSKLVEVLNRNMALNDGACAAFFMPWLSRYFPRLIGWNNYISDANFIFDFWVKFAEKEIKEIQSKNSESEMVIEQNSFLMGYCDKIQKCDDPSSSFYDRKGVMSLATVLQDLFIAGSETTATTLQWICLYLAAFPSCQEKVSQEIKAAFWKHQSNFQIDRDRLPYTEAFIRESLRFSTLAPLGMLHCTTEDVEFHGHFIPKDTILQMNTCAAHFDKKCWTNPEEFQPERFFSRDYQGKLIKGEIPGYLPFSFGKRLCPGAEVAKQALFLATVRILQEFEVRTGLCNNNVIDGSVELRPKIGVSAVPYPHQLIFIKRRFV